MGCQPSAGYIIEIMGHGDWELKRRNNFEKIITREDFKSKELIAIDFVIVVVVGVLKGAR